MVMPAAVAVLVVGCRNEMYDQPRYEPQEAAEFFRDGTSQRPTPAGTVARLSPADEPRCADHEYLARFARAVDDPTFYDHYYEGKVDGKTAETFPIKLEKADVERGRDRFMIYCSPCHGPTGDGKGLIVLRGFSPPPPFYGKLPQVGQTPVAIYDDLRKAPVGHFFDVMTHGHGAMYSYAQRVPPDDRWRIAAYIRALQFSQAATREDLESIAVPNAEETRLIQEFQR
jgi:mono/diheme cytochrome c family protein